MKDRFGVGWRPELAAAIFGNLDRLDVIEVIADDYFDASPKKLRALTTLRAQLPIVLHGIQLGMASTVEVDRSRLEKMARVFKFAQPDFWSEHLAFVRGGGIEIGHLAAPPRCAATIEGAVRNIRIAESVVGAKPLVENIATLIDPPGSDQSEFEWTSQILNHANGELLLDLHNLHANAVNFGFDAPSVIRQLPQTRIAAIHLAGGRWIGRPGKQRLLDDHLHDVPDAVFDLLTVVGEVASRPLTVILERDGHFPPIANMLDELDRARRALAKGRQAREARHVACV
jgi:uncharacterized protein (UPF0276 family)